MRVTTTLASPAANLTWKWEGDAAAAAAGGASRPFLSRLRIANSNKHPYCVHA